MTACWVRRLENTHYESEGQAHKGAILLSRGSTKEALSELDLEGWEESGCAEGVGRRGSQAGRCQEQGLGIRAQSPRGQ